MTTYTATYQITGNVTASVTLTISTTANSSGDYPITAVSGTWNGEAITGLLAAGSIGNNDNLAVPPGNSGFDDLDGQGVSFSTSTRNINLFSTGSTLQYSTNLGIASTTVTATFSTNVPCFLSGTEILTEHGDVAVENLAVGDRVFTVTNQLLPIKWIGTRRYLPDPVARRLWQSVAPIRIRQGAIADNLPYRDLLVSPDHSLFLAGHLFNAKTLVNGVSIVQDTGIAEIAYFHIELERHEVILANGMPAESYLENGNRGQFHNAAAFADIRWRGAVPLTAARAKWYAPHAYGDHPVHKQVFDLLAARGAGMSPRLAAAA